MYYTAIKHTISFPSTNHSPTTPPLGGGREGLLTPD